jgi:hypothetical protein
MVSVAPAPPPNAEDEVENPEVRSEGGYNADELADVPMVTPLSWESLLMRWYWWEAWMPWLRPDPLAGRRWSKRSYPSAGIITRSAKRSNYGFMKLMT